MELITLIIKLKGNKYKIKLQVFFLKVKKSYYQNKGFYQRKLKVN